MVLTEGRKLLRIRVYKNNLGYTLIGNNVSKNFFGDDYQFRLFLKRIKASDSTTKPISQRQTTYTQMLQDIISKKDNVIVVWDYIWNKLNDRIALNESLQEKDNSSKILTKNKNYFSSIKSIAQRVSDNKKKYGSLTSSETKVYNSILNFIKDYKKMYAKKEDDIKSLDEDADLTDKVKEKKTDNIKNDFASNFVGLTMSVYEKLQVMNDKAKKERITANKEKKGSATKKPGKEIKTEVNEEPKTNIKADGE